MRGCDLASCNLERYCRRRDRRASGVHQFTIPSFRPRLASGAGKPGRAACETCELRLRGRDGIARALYVAAIGRRVVVVRAFVKKTQRTPRTEIELALRRAKEIT